MRELLQATVDIAPLGEMSFGQFVLWYVGTVWAIHQMLPKRWR
jgi:hypothetical protein